MKLDKLFKIVLTFVFAIVITNCHLIQPLSVYVHVVRYVHDFFNNTCIIFLHASDNPSETQDLKIGLDLKKLQFQFSGSGIRMAIMSVNVFVAEIGVAYYHIKRPLFVLLNDSDELRQGFADVAGWIDMSYPTWLIFFGNGTKIETYFDTLYIPFDCEFMVAQTQNDITEITEVYRVDRNSSLLTSNFGFISLTEDTDIKRKGLYDRRNNLHGKYLRVGVTHNPSISELIKDDDQNVISVEGYFGVLSELLQQRMNCTMTFYEIDEWDFVLETGKSAGVMSLLGNKTLDLALGPIAITEKRLEVAEFTIPLFVTRYTTYIKRPLESVVKWEGYMAPFKAGIWTAIALIILISSGMISCAKSLSKMWSSHVNDLEHSPSKFNHILLLVFGAFCNQGIQPSLLDPVRIIHLIVHLTAVVVVAAYSAALISFLAVKTISMPFTTMAGLLEDNTYDFAVVANSSEFYFCSTTLDFVVKSIYEKKLRDNSNLPTSYEDGLKRLCKEEKYAFMLPEHQYQIFKSKLDCIIEPLDSTMQASIGMPVSMRSPYRGVINSVLLIIKNGGILQRVLNARFYNVKGISHRDSWVSVEIGDVVVLNVILLLGIILGLLILYVERSFPPKTNDRTINIAKVIKTKAARAKEF
ncbi:uncharacterized protein LOC107272053 isoform X2 [Cephus cinctus]|uniref:Uncharacterized protein LOC107272053 isoform X2 n=1 Tax=Cephus cinctus TaxID=211228 RepID=A0AAJ7C833_CEPCN|nr:uncharacterized protein LOC107272053 isoform X2 [Cephus cinctus]